MKSHYILIGIKEKIKMRESRGCRGARVGRWVDGGHDDYYKLQSQKNINPSGYNIYERKKFYDKKKKL